MNADTADILRKQLIKDMEVEDGLMLKLVEAIPEEQVTWRPAAEKVFRTNELAHHAVAAASFFLRTIDGTGDRTEALVMTPRDKAALVKSVREIQSHFRKRATSYTPEQLAQKYDFFGDQMAGIEMLRWHKMHMVHHRAQLALYLRLMGAKVPGTYGPSGDD